MYKKEKCPVCNQEELISIIYGFPSIELFELSEKGLIKLGGCCLPTNSYNNILHYYCNNCKKEIIMAPENNKNLFRYMLKDVYGRICSKDILIVDSKENNLIYDCEEFPLKISIDYDDILKIKNIINKNKYIFKIKDVPVAENVLDGSRNEFIFWNGRKVNYIDSCNLSGWDIENCTKKNVKYMLKILNEIGEILKKYEIKLLVDE